MSATNLPPLAAKKIRKWVDSEITRILGFSDESIINYVLTIDNKEALLEYISAFFPPKEAKPFCREYAQLRLKAMTVAAAPAPAPASASASRTSSEKNAGKPTPVPTTKPKEQNKPSAAFAAARGRPSRRNGFGKGKPVKLNAGGKGTGKQKPEPSISIYKGAAYTKAQKKKEKELAKAATKHDWYTCTDKDLLGNCLHCGKVICRTEGTKFCSFCSAPLSHILNSKKAKQDRHDELEAAAAEAVASGQPVSEKWKALQRKERLLQWDRSQAARSHVYDDQNDYFADTASAWLSFEEQEKARRKLQRKEEKRAHRQKVRKYTVDLAGRRVMEESSSSSDYSSDDELLAAAMQVQASNSDPSNDPFFKPADGVSNGNCSSKGPTAAEVIGAAEQQRERESEAYVNTTLRGRAREIYKLIKKQKRAGVLGGPPPPASSAAKAREELRGALAGGMDAIVEGDGAQLTKTECDKDTDGVNDADGSQKEKKRKKRSALQHSGDAGPVILEDASAEAPF